MMSKQPLFSILFLAAVSLAGLCTASLRAQEAEPLPAQEVAAPQPPTEIAVDPESPDFDALEAHIAESPTDLLSASKYRQQIIAAEAFDRSVAFFRQLAKDHPDEPLVHLSLGYALVDKIPSEGSITQVLLANEALKSFTRSLELAETWLGLYTRGHSYVFWPPIFGRTQLGIDDLERALEIAETLPRNLLHSRAWVALGDAYWRLDDLDQAREIWSEGQERYPEQDAFAERLELDDAGLNELLHAYFDPLRRVDTDLSPLWPGDRSVVPGEVVAQKKPSEPDATQDEEDSQEEPAEETP